MLPETGRDIVIDSTGLKVYGEGEWKARKHGVSTRLAWRKFHIGIDPKTGEIVGQQLAGNDTRHAKTPSFGSTATPANQSYLAMKP